MASYCIHMSHGLESLKQFRERIVSDKANRKTYLNNLKRINKDSYDAIILQKKNKWRRQFMAGLILPDAAKKSSNFNSEQNDKMSHYAKNMNSYFKTPNMEQFLLKHPVTLDEPLYLGYAMHLYMDVQYEYLLKGKYSFMFSENNTEVSVGYFDSNYNKIVLSSDDFWKKMYQDYTLLNPHYVRKYNIKIEEFAVTSEIYSDEPANIIWYSEFYQEIKRVLEEAGKEDANNEGDNNSNKVELINKEIIDAIIEKTAIDFCNQYLMPIIKKNDNKKYKSKRKKNDEKWKAERLKLEYYKDKWKNLLKRENVSELDEGFFDGVVEEISDVSNQIKIHRKNHDKITFLICLFPVCIAAVSASFTALRNICPKISIILGVLSTTLSAILSAIIQYDEKTAHKETWLRHNLYYSMLMDETESFCEQTGNYDGLEATESIKMYMDSIRKLRKKDYENFLKNMGYSDYEN